MLAARISLTLSRHSSLSFIALGRSSGQQPVSSHSCWMYVRAGRPAFARPCVGIHKSTSLMSSSLLLQQCPACLVRLTWIVFVIGGRWPYFMPTYSLLDPFEFPYYFYRIRGELIKVLSIVVCIPSTFCPTLGHHQGRICYKSDVTFVLANYYCVRTSLLLEIMALAFKCNSVNSASS